MNQFSNTKPETKNKPEIDWLAYTFPSESHAIGKSKGKITKQLNLSLPLPIPPTHTVLFYFPSQATPLQLRNGSPINGSCKKDKNVSFSSPKLICTQIDHKFQIFEQEQMNLMMSVKDQCNKILS
jgi:hypothetical protein